jgi:hypothetical protein
MAKIEYIAPGQAIPNDEEPAAGLPKQIETTVTPNPKTRAERRGNVKAERLRKAQERQGQTTPPSREQSERQRQRSRKRRRDIYNLAAKADAARDRTKQN